MKERAAAERHDVVIIGAGVAGLSLARQLLLASDKTILLVDRRAEIPPPRQKVGEATVQVSGYYFSKVLDLEEHLHREHFMKYNLRFYWKTPGRENRCFEDYSQSYIRPFSNIASYQLDRNKLEAELFRLNRESPRFTFCAPIAGLDVSLSESGRHTLRFTCKGRGVSVSADWVVDTSGRGKVLTRRMGLVRRNPIRHGSSFIWVDGLVNIEKLTDLSPTEVRLKRDRAAIGHLPVWLATNHFMGEGYWFWVIPLQGKTSLGLVFDNAIIPYDRVSTPRKLVEWVCREFPLFARDLPGRTILDHGAYRDFSYDCAQTISKSRWAMSGEAGRFSDPLYSPGGDLIALYNTLITDAITTGDDEALATKVRLYEPLMRALYEAYVPSYALSYDVLGDQETMTLKYTWELAVYFSFYVFPFINDLFADVRFAAAFLGRFARLGRLNRGLQAFLRAYYHWKQENGPASPHRPRTACGAARVPMFNDFTELGPLRVAERLFYQVGVSVDEARQILDTQLANLTEFARYIVAHINAAVLFDDGVLTSRRFVESLDLDDLCFDPNEMHERHAGCAASAEPYEWPFEDALRRFRVKSRTDLVEAAAVPTGVGGVPWTTTLR